jgi:hypothetical protein
VRPIAFLALLLLSACRKREEVAPAPETKPSAPPPRQLHSVESMSCHNGVFGLAEPASPPPPRDADSGTIGLGAVGVHMSKASGTLAPLPRILGAPVTAGDDSALSIARTACEAHEAIRSCGDPAPASLTFELTVEGKKATVRKVDTHGVDEEFVVCVAAALRDRVYGAPGRIAYRVTFEPPKDPSVAGGLAAADIHRVVRANAKKVRGCYESALKTQPTLVGSLRVKLAIDANGDVSAATIEGGTITDPTMRSCVTTTLKSVTFPKSASSTVVSYPLSFASAK